MWFVRFLCQWGGGIVMAVAFLIGIPDSLTATRKLVAWVSPYGVQPIHVAFWLLAIGAFYTTFIQALKIKRLENQRPKITVEQKVYYSDKAVLEIHNYGSGDTFKATARVVKGNIESNFFNLYWQSYPNDTDCQINHDDTESILVAEIASKSELNDNERTAVFEGGIALYQAGGKRIGVCDYKVIEGSQLRKRYPTMFEDAPELVDECEIEVTITSSKQLSRPFDKQRYLIKIDLEHNRKLVFIPVSSSHKEGSQTE